MKYMEKVVIILLFSLCLASAQQERCGSIGESTEPAGTPSRAQMFYLDTANPANCTGNVTSWRVCYYGPDSVNDRGSYWAMYAVYRRTGSGNNNSYGRVSEIFRATRAISGLQGESNIDGEIIQGGFNCYDDSIDVGNSPLTIQAGDILGACVFNPNDERISIPLVGPMVIVVRLPLDVVSEASGNSLLQMGTDGCSRTNIPSDISTDQLSTVNSRRLHIYANIEREPVTTQSPATTMATAAITTIAAQTVMPMTTDPTITLDSTATTTTEFHETNSIPTDNNNNNEGSQVSQVIAIAAGSAGGGLLVLLLLCVALVSTIVYLASQKRKIYNSSSSSQTTNEYFNKPAGDEKFTTETNVAYKPVVRTETGNAGFEIMHGSTEQKSSTENQVSKLNMEQNVAYESSNTVQISLGTNIAYYESGRQLEENVYENDLGDDQYDYI